MKLNNKGVTLIEIIVSVALISIVLIFLFSLLIQVNNENSDNEVKSSYLVNQSTFIKQIEEDFLDYGLEVDASNKVKGGKCSTLLTSPTNASGSTTSESTIYIPRWNGEAEQFKCLTFRFADKTESLYAHLFLYQRSDDNKTILSYYRGDFKQSVELEEFDWEKNVDISGYQLSVKINEDITNGMYAYSLPIIGPDYNDYSINLSYAN